MYRALISVIRDTRAATAIEYGLIATFIAIAAIAAMQGLGNAVQKPFNNVSTKLNSST